MVLGQPCGVSTSHTQPLSAVQAQASPSASHPVPRCHKRSPPSPPSPHTCEWLRPRQVPRPTIGCRDVAYVVPSRGRLCTLQAPGGVGAAGGSVPPLALGGGGFRVYSRVAGGVGYPHHQGVRDASDRSTLRNAPRCASPQTPHQKPTIQTLPDLTLQPRIPLPPSQ